MSDDALDPLIHAPARLRIVVTLAALREGDALSSPRLQRTLDLTPGNLITHLRKLEAAGYVVTEKSDAGPSAGHLGHAHARRTPGSRGRHRHPARHPRRRLNVRHLQSTQNGSRRRTVSGGRRYTAKKSFSPGKVKRVGTCSGFRKVSLGPAPPGRR
jgi:Helix-turn-helix domain